MPLVTIKAPEAVFTEEQKQDMIERVTEAMVHAEGDEFRDKMWVVYEEVPAKSWAIGGELIGPR